MCRDIMMVARNSEMRSVDKSTMRRGFASQFLLFAEAPRVAPATRCFSAVTMPAPHGTESTLGRGIAFSSPLYPEINSIRDWNDASPNGCAVRGNGQISSTCIDNLVAFDAPN